MPFDIQASGHGGSKQLSSGTWQALLAPAGFSALVGKHFNVNQAINFFQENLELCI